MSANESSWDRIIRVVIGLALGYWGFFQMGGGLWGIILGVIGLVLLVTGAIGFCPIYGLVGLSTKKS